MASKRTVEQVLRELEREERRRGLLAMGGAPASLKGGLLSSAAVGAPGIDKAAFDAAAQATDAMPNVGSGPDAMTLANLSKGPVTGLLGTAPVKAGGVRGLLTPALPEAPQPQMPQERSALSRAGNFLDDFLFGGAAGERSAERRERERAQAQAAAHEAAFAQAMAGGAFDPAIYSQAMAQRGAAPDMAGLMQLEGVTDSQDVRGMRGRQERREVTAGALAPVVRPGASTDALPGVLEYLQSQGMPYSGPTDPAALSSAVGAGMGANAYLDNDRGERALAENIRSNVAGEEYRNRDFGFRQQVDERNFGYQRERDRADDAYRYSRAEAEDSYRRWQMENDLTRSDIEGRVLRKAIEQGAENLTPEERAVYDRAVTVTGQGFGWGGMMPGAPGLPGVTPSAPAAPAPAAPASQPQRGGDGRSPQSPAIVQTEEDYARLPAGSYFVDPGDGRVYRK